MAQTSVTYCPYLKCSAFILSFRFKPWNIYCDKSRSTLALPLYYPLNYIRPGKSFGAPYMGHRSACRASGDSEATDMPRVSERPFDIGMREATISPLVILKPSTRSCIACRSVPTLQEQNLFGTIVAHWRPPFIAMAHQSTLEASSEGYSINSLEFELLLLTTCIPPHPSPSPIDAPGPCAAHVVCRQLNSHKYRH